MFFWIDGFSIDEHQGFYGDKSEDNSEVWAETFKLAIQKMGTTVMVLAPWSLPVVLTRMWCLVSPRPLRCRRLLCAAGSASLSTRGVVRCGGKHICSGKCSAPWTPRPPSTSV